MPRKPRFFLPGVPVHVVQRGHNREPVFFDDADYQAYLTWLSNALERHACKLHAYVLMTNHIHLLITPKEKNGVSRVMQSIGRYYVPYINDQYQTSGSLWEGRYKSSLIHEDEYLLACMRYIELNPVVANMVKHPRHYRWSSYRINGEGKEKDKADKLITPHPLYLSLGKTADQRHVAYRALFKAHVDADEVKNIRAAVQTGTPLGNDAFRDKVEEKLKMKVGRDRRGRPSFTRSFKG
ncbi:MAG: transposase [Gammaproteobacteria bacterium]